MKTTTAVSGYHHGDLRNALLQAAGQILEAEGAAGLSLRAIARQAGVSHAAPYRHFRDKGALLRALAQTGFEQLAATLHAAAAAAPHNAEQQLIEAGVAYVRRAVDQPAITQLMFGGTLDPQGDAAYQHAAAEACEALVGIVREGIGSGVFRDRDAQELALVAWTSMHGLAMLMMAQLPGLETADPDEQVRRVARTVIYGLSK